MDVRVVTQALYNHGRGLARDGWLRAKELAAKHGHARSAGVVVVCGIAAAGIAAAALSFCFLLLFLATCALVPLVLATACLAGLACLWSSVICCWAAFCAACFCSWLGVLLLAGRFGYWVLNRLGIYHRLFPTTTPAIDTPATPDPTSTPAPPATTIATPLPHAGTKHPRTSSDPTRLPSNPTPAADRPQPRPHVPAFPRSFGAPATRPTPKRRKARPPSKRPYPELLHVYKFSLDSTPPSDNEADPLPPASAMPSSAPSPATADNNNPIASPASEPPAKLAAPSTTPFPAAATATTAGAPTEADTAPAAPRAAAATATTAGAPTAADTALPAPSAVETQSSAAAASAAGEAAGPARAAAPNALSSAEPSLDDISLPLAPQVPAT